MDVAIPKVAKSFHNLKNMNQNTETEKEREFNSDRQSTRNKSVDPGQYPYKNIVASVRFFCKSWSFW